MTRFEESFWEQKGYEELRKSCRQGSDFCKEIAAIFNERSKIELSYADSLSKLSVKAQKLLAKDVVGTLKSSWEKISWNIESEADIHRTLANQLHGEAAKQIKAFVETQSKTRKPVEVEVEKAYKNFSDRLSDSLKKKGASHSKSKEVETLHDQMEDTKQGKGKAVSDKDITKLEAKIKKGMESAIKSDKDYREMYMKTERTRLEWEATMSKYCQTCEKLEEERVGHLKDMFSLYGNMLAAVIPELQQVYESIQHEASQISPKEDVNTIADVKGSPRGPSEQTLYDCYEEDLENNFNFERRKEALNAKIKILASELEKEKKAKTGVVNLMDTYSATPEYCNQETQNDVAMQITHVNAVIDSLQASSYKLQCSLAKLTGNSQPQHPLMDYITSTRDKQGTVQSTLRKPLDLVKSPGGYESDDQLDDEFDDFQPDGTVLCQCKAIYDYQATQSDELTIHPGDIITVTARLDNGWWQGDLNNQQGIFPASYVEEI
ncbi:predicted protein [Nematostella vectensis]|uniref:Nostrin n=1 Tax=Nematostella vectensis TaxID=45351 RepID=A7RXM7_NEMVE|nr:predicted protein [Nematostella vectensis]|eukprot:XP_001635935.1 predicted protein [Nematostella vectensis]